MDLKNFYNENENYIKWGAKAVGVAAGAFFTGFVMYFLKYRKQLKSGEDIEKKPEFRDIPIEKLEKMLNKIKGGVIHNMVLLHDLSHKYDPEEFTPKQTDDIEIEVVKVEEVIKKEENPEELLKPEITESLILENQASKDSFLTKQSDSRIDTFKREYKPLLDKPKIINERLLNFEITKIKTFEVEPDEYYFALKKNIDNEKIKKNIQFITDFKKYFDKDELMPIDFGDEITKNYLKIICNIYYINLRKTQKKFKNEFVDKGYDFKDASETANSFNDIYKSFLKETRNEVMALFNVPHSENLSNKIKLRIYPLYFSPYHPLRIQYEKINHEVNLIIKKIQLTGSIDELYDDNHPLAILKPVDKMIDFEHLIVQKVTPQLNKAQPLDESQRKERILTTFEEKYANKDNETD